MTWEQAATALLEEGMALQKENDRLRDGIQTVVSYIQHDIESGQLNQQGYLVAKSAQDHLLELISPTAEGGGAANGGESKPLVITATVTEAMRNQWHLAKSGESQALQAAILGLHTLAGEFPTATWKTREDYLQATISEINEILGKQ